MLTCGVFEHGFRFTGGINNKDEHHLPSRHLKPAPTLAAVAV